MGIFDEVYFRCPECDYGMSIQSKAAEDPYLVAYDLETAPTNVLNDVLNRPEQCGGCYAWLVLHDPRFPVVPSRAKPSVCSVKPPKRQSHETGEHMYWPDDQAFEIIVDEAPKGDA